MYKHIGKFGFESYTFIPEIEGIIDYHIKDLMEQFKYSLYKNYILNSPNKDYSFTHNQINDVKKVINSEVGFEVKIDPNAAFSLLSEILSNEMEEFMVVPLSNIEKMEKRKSQLKVNISFDDFEKQKDILVKSKGDFLINGLEVICNEYKEASRSGYFQLYKVRNIILKPIKERMYSINTLNKTIKEMKKSFRQALYILIIKKEKKELSSQNLKDILIKLFNCYVSQFIDYHRLGKTDEEGNKLIESLKKQMNLEEIKEKFLKEMFPKFSEDFHQLLEIEGYIEFSKKIIGYLEAEFRSESGIIVELRAEYFPNFLIFILGEIFSSCSDIDRLINDTYEYFSNDLKEETAQSVIEENLSIGKLIFAIRASGLSIHKNFYSKRLTSNIEVMSHSLFNAWQHEQYKEMGINRHPTIIDVPDEEKLNTVWFIITDINCANKDTDLGYEIAKVELEKYLKFSYYFLARENEYNFGVIDPYICYNKETRNINLGRKNNITSYLKDLETFPKDILEFSKDLFDSKQPLHIKIIQCISLYYKMINEDQDFNQPKILLEIWEIIFDTNDVKEIASYASIVIAGTNYRKGDITYGDMRKILYEDFEEFITHANDDRSVMLLASVFDRFKVFTKNIIGTFLFNIPVDSSRKYEVNDILEWILYINPNEENISVRETSHDED